MPTEKPGVSPLADAPMVTPLCAQFASEARGSKFPFFFTFRACFVRLVFIKSDSRLHQFFMRMILNRADELGRRHFERKSQSARVSAAYSSEQERDYTYITNTNKQHQVPSWDGRPGPTRATKLWPRLCLVVQRSDALNWGTGDAWARG